MRLAICSAALVRAFVARFSLQHVMSCAIDASFGSRRFGSHETDTNEFGVKEPLERKENSSAGFECFDQPGESRVGSELCFMWRQETDAKQQPRPNSILSRVATR